MATKQNICNLAMVTDTCRGLRGSFCTYVSITLGKTLCVEKYEYDEEANL
jgi:hypothetical protein